MTEKYPSPGKIHFGQHVEHGWKHKRPEPKAVAPIAPAKVKRLYKAPAKVIQKADDLEITDKGTYVIEWGSMFRDLAALMFEGVGIVIFGHLIALSAICMLIGIGLGIFGLRLKTKHIKRR